MAKDDLKALKAAVAAAVSERRSLPTEDEGVKAVMPVVAYIDESRSRVVWQTVSRIRQDAPDVYNWFVGERVLYDLIVDVVAERGDGVDFDGLVAELTRIADERSRWLIAVPLANIISPESYVTLDEFASIAMTVQERDWLPSSEAPASSSRIFQHLRDRLFAGVRWRRDDDRLGPLDTRRTAVLYLVEDGTQTMAVSVARSRARLILALWCLFEPPDWRELWPSLAEWEPRPYLYHAIDHKLYQPEVWIGGERVHGRSITEYAEYALPSDDLVPTAVRITRLATDHLSARAVASASWSLHVAEREPSTASPTELGCRHSGGNRCSQRAPQARPPIDVGWMPQMIYGTHRFSLSCSRFGSDKRGQQASPIGSVQPRLDAGEHNDLLLGR
jgi:hypothetical protein